jgi:hypothetical protein
MTKITPRAHPRTPYQAPIQYALLNTDEFSTAHTFNFSDAGLCYEACHKMEPDADVCIVMQNYTPGNIGPEAYHSYVARIRWIHLLSQNGSRRYAAGAQIVARSHEILSTDQRIPPAHCDLCGCLEPMHKVTQTETGIALCRLCLKHFNNIPSLKIRQCVERFLIGNVV